MIVMKFGGTSVADAAAINDTIQRIIENKAERKFVILSACSGTTDQLIKITKIAIKDLNSALKLIDELLERHCKIIEELEGNINEGNLTQTHTLESFKSKDNPTQTLPASREGLKIKSAPIQTLDELKTKSNPTQTLPTREGFRSKSAPIQTLDELKTKSNPTQTLPTREGFRTDCQYNICFRPSTNEDRLDFDLKPSLLAGRVWVGSDLNIPDLGKGWVGSDLNIPDLGKGWVGSDLNISDLGKGWVGSDLNISDLGKGWVGLCKERILSIITQLRELAEGIYYLNECTPKVYDSVISCGELMSTTIVSYALSVRGFENKWLDSRDLLKTNNEFNSATVDFSKTIKQLENLIQNEFINNNIFITQGFIGSDTEGRTTTLGRGGSDYSAAIYGNCFHNSGVDVSEIQIWTDVNGVMTADPRILKNALSIDEMSFEEVLELSFYGAKVLHPDTIKPAIDLNIPVVVLNTFNPEFKGTVIKANCCDNSKFKSIVPIFGCQSIKFTSNNQEELLKKSSDLNHKLNLLGIKIFLSTISCFVLNIIIKKTDFDFNQFIEANNYKEKNIDLIAIVINISNFSNSDYLEFHKQIADIPVKVYTGFSYNSILLESVPERTIEICKMLHDKLILN
jgi:aspartate kinase